MNDRLHELLSVWENATVRPSVDDLCKDLPDNEAAELRACINALQQVDGVLHSRTHAAQAPTPPAIPGYHLTGELGRGAMGVVYAGLQLGTRRQVALKVLTAHASPAARQRFEREVQLAASLSHPNIARVYDSGLHNDQYYYAMELIDGIPLDRFVEDLPLTLHQKLHLFRRVCRAVGHAHHHALVHRDLKPANILVDRHAQPHVLDFGLALANHDIDALTTLDARAGTPAYMAPEQAAGRAAQVDARADVFSLGLILHRLATGTPAHDLPPQYAHALAVLQQPVTPPSARHLPIDPPLEAILMRALAPEPAHRYPDAAALADAIGAYLAAQLPPAPPAAPYWRHPAVITLAFTTTACSVLLLLMAFLLTRRPPPPADLSPQHLQQQIDARRDDLLPLLHEQARRLRQSGNPAAAAEVEARIRALQTPPTTHPN